MCTTGEMVHIKGGFMGLQSKGIDKDRKGKYNGNNL